jgi:hypothetical protein
MYTNRPSKLSILLATKTERLPTSFSPSRRRYTRLYRRTHVRHRTVSYLARIRPRMGSLVNGTLMRLTAGYARTTNVRFRLMPNPILHLLPGVGDEDIRCELVNTSLNEKPRYEAISYTWVSSSNLQKIILNGTACLRRHNLLECLHALRHPINIRVLFVDALCINQANVLEKSSQVALMSQIYRSAFRTLIWLGNDGTYARPRFYVSP